jgi:hypothetical protein
MFKNRIWQFGLVGLMAFLLGVSSYHFFNLKRGEASLNIIRFTTEVPEDMTAEPETIFALRGFPEKRVPNGYIEEIPEEAVEMLYRHTPFRVVAIVPNQFSDKGEVLYIVTRRGYNDMSCGGFYTIGDCHLFLETNYADEPVARYLGTGPVQVGDTPIRFVDSEHIEYEQFFGDAGMTSKTQMRYNIFTRDTEVLSRESCEYNFETEEHVCVYE